MCFIIDSSSREYHTLHSEHLQTLLRCLPLVLPGDSEGAGLQLLHDAAQPPGLGLQQQRLGLQAGPHRVKAVAVGPAQHGRGCYTLGVNLMHKL